MPRQQRRVVVALLAVLVVLGGLPTVAVAQQSGTDGPASETSGAVVRIDENETFDGSLDATAGAVVVAGTVDGDVSARAGSVLVTETGRVTGDLEAAAGSVILEGTVDGDIVVSAAALEFREGATIGGALDAGVANARLAGSVGSDAAVDATTLTVTPTATVDGSLTYRSEDATIADGAAISGEVTRDEDLEVASPGAFGGGSGPDLPSIPPWVGAVYSALSSLLLGVILLLAMPNFGGRVAEVGTTRPLRSGGIGLLTLVGTPVALLILFVTIVGIPLSFVGVLVFGAVLLAASVYGAFVTGTWLLSLGDYRNRWAALVAGVAAVAVLGRIPIVGGLAQFAVLLLGLGALAAALYELRGADDGADAEDVGADQATLAE
ncbi:bactofilin family protein [Halobellus ruber]|uniref:Polymer-forming cytoskeletal protein n=1 Tax=Halobellus ruber TaxID=2761102 RepID=A0A7J9SM84_9EURY|nr:polymer-forming cytoskeletal protein [Halobellus ruber]MBB6646141.1 polymer-forming cytoskeletal protein [Halobellus ruber]